MKGFYEFTAFPDREGQSNNLQSILDDISSLPEHACARLTLSDGVYRGQFFFDGNKNNIGNAGVTLLVEGCGIGKTVLSGSLAASQLLDDGIKRGTFRTYTAYFSGPKVELRNLSIENTSGFPPPVGSGRKALQGIAMYAAAERMICRSVELSGHQDTLFMAPLPSEEREKGGFRGPGEFSLRNPTLQLYEDCIISGTIDFVFGGASALFRKCEFVVRNGGQQDTPYGKKESFPSEVPLPAQKTDTVDAVKKFYVAAPCCDSPLPDGDSSSGFFFEDSFFRTKALEGEVYLARPWRPYGRCFFFDCRVGEGIAESLWSIWNTEEDKKTAGFYAKELSFDKKETAKAVDWGKTLSENDKIELLKKMKAMLGIPLS